MAVWLALTLLFLWQITISVWRDLYGTRTTQALEGRPTVAACTNELESMNRDLEARVSVVQRPRDLTKAEADWDVFARNFEDRLQRVQSRCVDEELQGEDESVRSAMRTCVENLDSLRQHMARCGLEGEGKRRLSARTAPDGGQDRSPMRARTLLACVASVVACAPKPVAPLPACSKTLWNRVLLPSSYNGVAEVYPEGLALDAPEATPLPNSSGELQVPLLSVQQYGLEGDFTLTVTFDSFTVGDTNGGFDVELANGTGDLYTQITRQAFQATYAPPSGAVTTQNANITASTGTVVVTRQGESGTIMLTAAGQSVGAAGPIGAGEVALYLEAFAPQSGGDLSVLVKSVTLSGGSGPFQADSFSCDSVSP
jgi:hypothetical protein